MNRAETALLLAKIQASDRRTVGEVDVLAWQEALGDVDPKMAGEAVTNHVRTSSEWLTPKHILDYIRTVHRQRLQDAGPVDYPTGLNHLQERDYRLVWQDAVKSGAKAADATARADLAFGVTRGELVEAPQNVKTAIERFTAGRRA